MMVVPLSLSQDFVLWALSRMLEVSLKSDKSHLMMVVEVTPVLILRPSNLFPLMIAERIQMLHPAFSNY
jgi:hypothetical protein